MPNHAGPNTKGEENLVFGYDLGDVKNSYKGEPTTNFVAEIADPTLEISRGEFGQYLNLVPIFETHGLVPYTLSMEIKGNRPGGCLVYMQNGSYTKYGFVGTSVNITTEWQRFSFRNLTPSGPTSAWQANTPNDNRAMLATYTTYGSGVNPTVRNIQIEYGSHETPFTASTRSATQGLIDLNGNSAIDLTNVSFDSNAQMTFDGTSDYTSVSYSTAINTPNGATYEIMLYPQGAGEFLSRGKSDSGTDPDNPRFYVGSNGYLYFDWSTTGADTYVDTPPSTATFNQWNHVAGVAEPGDQLRIYVNGVEASYNTVVRTVPSPIPNTEDPIIIGGVSWIPRYFNGKVAMVKLYNRALTASEIKANYNAIKGRFNI